MGGTGFVWLVVGSLYIWAVIGWHRYVLLGEKPTIVPLLLPLNMIKFFWRVILVSLVIVTPAGIVGAFAGLFGSMVGAFAGRESAAFLAVTFGGLVGTTIATMIAYRLSPMFPSIALSNDMTFRTAWAKLKGKNSMLAALALISTVISLIFGATALLIEPESILALAYSFVIGWLELTIGASIVTTLYGVYVEGRELQGT